MFNPEYFAPFYYIFTTLFTLYWGFTLYSKDEEMIHENTNSLLILLYIIAFVLIIGYRPHWKYFGDSVNYEHVYNMYVNGTRLYDPKVSEWLFDLMMYKCSQIMDVKSFFLIVEILYVFPVLWACRKFVPNHYIIMFLFCMGAFSFYSYAYNGIRNGMACSLIIAAMACVNQNLLYKVIGLLLAFLAFNIHRSTALPIVCILGSFFVKDTRYIMGFWVASIFISLVAGGAVESFFTGLGFDDRMDAYSSQNIDASQFSSTGFRWDFLLYSSMPILLGYYVVFVRQVWDKNYLLLLNTYILCNSFWVMMIRASYSNRFAYLSWFMYALVLAYPCLKLPVWEDQGRKTALIIIGHLGFTLFMSFR